jgi:glycosyltransferase involved in cell wall biosynthesis
MADHDGQSGSLTSNVWPKIALVTPVFNAVRYIEETIQSVLAQNYPNLEYYVIDAGSTDGTLDIIRKYEKELSGWVSEPDKGMYDAINKGFARTSGEIMGWISATDKLHTGGLRVVGSVLRKFPDVEWIMGRATAYTDDGMTVVLDKLKRWSRYRFLSGANQAIQQESTFWRRSLWEKAGGRVDSAHRNGADFELWVRFFRHAQLYSVDALIGGFRCHPDSLGLTACYEMGMLHDEFVDTELKGMSGARLAKFLRRVTRAANGVPKVQGAWFHTMRGISWMLFHVPGADWPPVIENNAGEWVLRGR